VVSAVWKSKKKQMLIRLKETDEKILKSVVEMSFDSIVNGSHETGSPGQPRDLREPGEWNITYGKGFARIWTRDKSARSVEEGISRKYGGPIELKSDIGGFHSVKHTRRAIRKLLAKAAAQHAPKGASL
jgi:hypothetical protein